MISAKKEYVIRLFIKKCAIQNIMKSHINFSFKLLENTYNVEATILRKKYDIDDYIKRLTPVLDQQFTIEEMQEVIQFYSTKVGKKLLDSDFLQEIGKVGDNMIAQIEREFALNNKKTS